MRLLSRRRAVDVPEPVPKDLESMKTYLLSVTAPQLPEGNTGVCGLTLCWLTVLSVE